MTTLIIATVTAAFVYFAFAFIAHIVKGVCDRRRPKSQPVAIEPDPILPTPAKWSGFRPALVVQTANIYQSCSIRQLKKLASGRVKNYSKMTKSQLIAALA